MNYKHVNKIFLIFIPIISFVILACLFCILSGAASPFVSCFSVDSQERLYVGLPGKIEVYENYRHVETISPQTSRSYVFTVLGNDTILLSTSSLVYSMDLSGNILDSWEDPGAQTYNEIQYKKYHFISINGNDYKLRSVLGWSRITVNDAQTVYRISPLSFVIKILMFCSALCLIGLVVVVLSSRVKEMT